MRFFFYGTLMAGHDNPATRATRGKLSPGLAATMPGRLYAITTAEGCYPALIPGGDKLVHGVVHTALPGFGEAELAALDAWENYDPHDHAASEYLRVPLIAHLADGGSCEAQTYIYAQALPEDARLIAEGDFLSNSPAPFSCCS